MRAPLATGLAAAVCAAVASLPATALAAPAATLTPSGSPSVTASPATPPPSSAVARAAIAQAPSGPSSGQLSREDRMFLTDAARDAQFQVMAGQLATDRAASAAVRQFGQRMVTGHGKELQRLQSLDRSLGVSPPSGVGPNQQNLLKIWKSVRGGPFDCSYAPTMYTAHELDVAMYALASRHAGNAHVRQFAASALPMLRQHLQMASKNLSNLKCSAPPPTAAPS